MNCGIHNDCHGCQLIVLLSIPTKHQLLLVLDLVQAKAELQFGLALAWLKQG